MDSDVWLVLAIYQGRTLDLHDDTGLAALKAAGLYDDFLKLARFDGDALAVCDKRLLCYLNIKATKQDNSWFSQSQGKPEIDRAELRQLLYDCLDKDTIRWGCRLRRVDPTDHSLHFDHGIEQGFDLVFGAEGAWSKVRQIITQEKPFYSGVGGYNLIVSDAEKRHPDLHKLVNKGSMFSFSDGSVIMGQQMSDKSLYVSVWRVGPEDWMETCGFDVKDGPAVKRSLTTEYRDWDPRVVKLIAESDDDKMAPRSLYMDRVGIDWPHKAGVTLLGDAAHLMTPFMGEGVNTAMRDAIELANAIESAIKDGGGDVVLDQSIEKYEAEMFVRAQRVTKLTEDMMKLMLFTEEAPRTVMEVVY